MAQLYMYGAFSPGVSRLHGNSIWLTPEGKRIKVSVIARAPDETMAREKLSDYFRSYPDAIFQGRIITVLGRVDPICLKKKV